MCRIFKKKKKAIYTAIIRGAKTFRIHPTQNIYDVRIHHKEYFH